MTVRFARESLTDQFWNEALPLLFAHWKEVAHYQDIELTPARDRYARLEANGVLRLYTARKGGGLLVGYALFSVTPSLHYAQILQAQQDVIYVQPDHRGTMAARLVMFCEEELFGEGVDIVYHHAKRAHRQLGRLLEHFGYEEIDVLYGKRRAIPAARAFPRIETSVEARR